MNRDDRHHPHDLDELLHDAVDDVHPRGGTAEVRARARRRAGRHAVARWLPVTAAAAVATVLVIGGTAWLGGRDDGPAVSGPGRPDPSARASSEASPGTATAGPGDVEQVTLYFVGATAQGRRLFSEQRVVDTRGRSKVQAAVEEALSQPPQDPDYDPWAVSGLQATTTVGAEQITIDVSGLDDSGSTVGRRDAEVFLQALVWTAVTATGSDLPVRFLADGRPVEEVLGVDTSAPLTRAGADSVLSPVSITTPAEGARLPTTFEVTGQASAYEGTVVWELRRGTTVVRSGSATTAEAFVPSPYSFSVTATPGDYTLVVHDTDESDGEGVGVTQDTRTVIVRTGF